MISMKNTFKYGLACTLISLCAVQPSVAEQTPDREEMWKIIKQQQEKIKKLEAKVTQNQETTEAITEVIEESDSSSINSGLASGQGWFNNTQLGGYGELHYNGGEKDEIDFHRFVLMVKHQFSDSLRLFTELELEHALSGDGKEGEVELEQAYIEYDLSTSQQLRAGVMLIPVGMINERHEPATFFGVERNPVESRIIPSTWWEAGVAAAGELPLDLSYDLMFHSGLKTSVEGDNAYNIRSGRQKVSEADAKDPAVTARLRWKGVPGIEIATSAQYQSDVTQGQDVDGVDAILLNSHLDLRKGPIGLRALYARWNLGGDGPKENGADLQQGWYVEPAYYLDTSIGQLGFFARYNNYDNNDGDSVDSEYEQIDVGINYWPHQNVVLKADYAFVNAPSGKEDDEILNLGLGFNY